MAEAPSVVFDIKAAEIAKLDLRANDVLVLVFPNRLSVDAGLRLRDDLQRALPMPEGGRRPVLILEGGASVQVIRPSPQGGQNV